MSKRGSLVHLVDYFANSKHIGLNRYRGDPWYCELGDPEDGTYATTEADGTGRVKVLKPTEKSSKLQTVRVYCKRTRRLIGADVFDINDAGVPYAVPEEQAMLGAAAKAWWKQRTPRWEQRLWKFISVMVVARDVGWVLALSIAPFAVIGYSLWKAVTWL